MLPGIFFLTTRAMQLTILIPLIGMLSYLIHGYTTRNLLTPNYILVLFIVSVLAGVWSLFTLVFYRTARRSGHFLAMIDLGIFAALIAGVALLRGIAPASCGNLLSFNGYRQFGPFINDWNKNCNILKACFGLAILCILLFFFSMFWSLWVTHHYRKDNPGYSSRTTTTRHHSSRHSHRRSGSRGGVPVRSSSGYRYDDRPRSRSRAGSSRSGGRNYDSRRSYV